MVGNSHLDVNLDQQIANFFKVPVLDLILSKNMSVDVSSKVQHFLHVKWGELFPFLLTKIIPKKKLLH